MAVRNSSWLAAALAVGALAAGCGSGTGSASHSATATAPAKLGSHQPTIPSPGPTGLPADPAAVAVITGWSDALRRGDVKRAARYFAFPSEMINGPDAAGVVPVIRIHDLAQAEAANATLPCGAKLLSTDRRGAYVNARFLLTDRPGLGGGCGSGIGFSARTNFVIAGGRIVEWIRAPDDPKDKQGGGGPSTPASPSPPATPPAPGPAV